VIEGPIHNTVLLYVKHLHAATHEALSYVHCLDADAVRAFHVPGGGTAVELRREWAELGDPLELEVVEPATNDPVATAVEYVRSLERPERDAFVTVVLPELMQRASVAQALRQGPALQLKLRLFSEPGVVVTDVPVLDEPGREPLAAEQVDPERSGAFVLVSDVDDATVNAVNYSHALHAFETRALHLELSPESGEQTRREWERRDLPIALEVVECPFREIGDPLLERVRDVTRHENAIAAIVRPEVVTGHRLQSLLHNRRGLYLRWLLQFEPRVTLSTVPLRL
jgi:hypothetical protein